MVNTDEEEIKGYVLSIAIVVVLLLQKQLYRLK